MSNSYISSSVNKCTNKCFIYVALNSKCSSQGTNLLPWDGLGSNEVVAKGAFLSLESMSLIYAVLQAVILSNCAKELIRDKI